jgi:hypothetical protein
MQRPVVRTVRLAKALLGLLLSFLRVPGVHFYGRLADLRGLPFFAEHVLDEANDKTRHAAGPHVGSWPSTLAEGVSAGRHCSVGRHCDPACPLRTDPEFRRGRSKLMIPRMDRNILFRCPRTGMNVQHRLLGPVDGGLNAGELARLRDLAGLRFGSLRQHHHG